MTARHERSPCTQKNRFLSEPITTVRPAHLGRNAGVGPLQSGYALPARPHPRVLILIDAGFSPCLSRGTIRYTERLADAGIDTSVGSVGDSYDNAMAESIIGLFKTEVINFLGPWKSMAQVEWETLQWVSWYNNERLHSAIGHRPPQEVEEAFYAQMNTLEKAA